MESDISLLQSMVDLMDCQQKTLGELVAQNKLLLLRVSRLEANRETANIAPEVAEEISSVECGGTK